MARVRMVTRTVELTVVEVMCLDVDTADVSIQTFELGGKYLTDKDILKSVESLTPSNVKAVHIQSRTTKETLYGMTEARFIELAEVLPPRFANEV